MIVFFKSFYLYFIIIDVNYKTTVSSFTKIKIIIHQNQN